MEKAALYGILRKRYWDWLKANWPEINNYLELSDDIYSMHPSYGSGKTRYADVSTFTREFERYLDTPDAIRAAALAIDGLKTSDPKDFQNLQLIVYGELPADKGSAGIQRKRRRIFNYLFSHLPERFIEPLIENEAIDLNSRNKYQSDRTQRAENIARIKGELNDLYRPDFLPWMLHLDTPSEELPADRKDFKLAWPTGTEEGRKIVRFGRLLTQYKKMSGNNTYRGALESLHFVRGSI